MDRERYREAEDKKDTKDKHDTYGHDHYGREIFVVHFDLFDFHLGSSRSHGKLLCCVVAPHVTGVTKVNCLSNKQKRAPAAENNGESRKHDMFNAHLLRVKRDKPLILLERTRQRKDCCPVLEN